METNKANELRGYIRALADKIKAAKAADKNVEEAFIHEVDPVEWSQNIYKHQN